MDQMKAWFAAFSILLLAGCTRTVIPEEEQKEDSEKDNDSEKTETEYPEFKQSKTADGVTVTVEADEGVFPEGARLSVARVSSSETEKAIRL